MDSVLSIEWPLLALAVAALLTAGAVQGSAGFGFNMLAAPILAVIDPVFVPGPMLIIAGLVCIGGAVREASSIDVRGLGFSLAGRVIAAVLAVLCLGLLDEATFSLVFGTIVLVAVLLSVLGLRIAATPGTLFAAGAASGFMGTLTSIGAPPMAIAYQNSAGPVMRSTLNAFFVFGMVISVTALFLSGNAEWGDVVLAAILAPFAFVGFLFSRWGRAFVDKGRVRVVVLAISTASAVILIARHLL
nr:sulfite exporter TauE/SafE family protein [Chelativorans sp.]